MNSSSQVSHQHGLNLNFQVSRQRGTIDLEFEGLKKQCGIRYCGNRVLLYSTRFNKVEYLVFFLFLFFYFLFRTTLLLISSSTACDHCVHRIGCIIAPWVQPILDKTPHQRGGWTSHKSQPIFFLGSDLGVLDTLRRKRRKERD